MWRRKLLILSSALLFLISIWAWAIFYTAYTNNKSVIKEITIQVSPKKILPTSVENSLFSFILRASTRTQKYSQNMARFPSKMLFDMYHRQETYTPAYYRAIRTI